MMTMETSFSRNTRSGSMSNPLRSSNMKARKIAEKPKSAASGKPTKIAMAPSATAPGSSSSAISRQPQRRAK